MKGLGTAEQALSDAAHAVDLLNEDEATELMKTIKNIKKALNEVETKFRK